MNAKDPSIWSELAEVLRLQATHMDDIADALERNNLDDLRTHLAQLLQLVASRQPVVLNLAPALDALVNEVFDGVGPDGPQGTAL